MSCPLLAGIAPRLRPGEWLLYDLHALVNAGGRGLVRGSIFGADGELAASVTQELLLG